VRLGPPDPVSQYIFCDLNTAILKNQYFCNGLTDFDEIWNAEVHQSSRPHKRMNFVILEIQDSGQV